MSELQKKVINDTAPVTLAECVYMGDGTKNTIKDEITSIKNNTSNEQPSTTNRYRGKKALWLGDSISVVGSPTYPKLVCDTLGMTLNNKASSGGNSLRMRQILQGLESYTAPSLTDIDFVFIMIGHNCDVSFANKDSIDSLPSHKDNTAYTDYTQGNFFCDIGSCVEYIRAKNSAIEIFFITPIQGKYESSLRYDSTSKMAMEGLKELGIEYSIPVIDVYGECGISNRNISADCYDDIHPNNTTGIPKIANTIIRYLLCH